MRVQTSLPSPKEDLYVKASRESLLDHVSDGPENIIEQAVWFEAEAAGHITIEHYENRMRNKLMYQLGLDDGAIAYDEEGFATALIAEGIKMEGRLTLHVYPADHKPAHFGSPDMSVGSVISGMGVGW